MLKNKILKVLVIGNYYTENFDKIYENYEINEVKPIFTSDFILVYWIRLLTLLKRYEDVFISSYDCARLYNKIFKKPVVTKTIINKSKRTFKLIKIQNEDIEVFLENI